MAAAFDPHFAFFAETPVDHKLYPNHLSATTDPNHLQYFRFFGLMVGKAIFEGVLLKATFARFFLNRFSGANQMDELQSLDPDLYSNLMKLKYYEGDASNLGLYFVVEEDRLGT